MSSAPIKSPVGGRGVLDDLKENAPAVYQELLDVKHDTPVNYRDSSQKRKHPERPDIFAPHAPAKE